MMDDMLSVRRTLIQYSYYVKHLISGLCEEFQTNRVHHNRIIPLLGRLFEKESIEFISFFNSEKESTSTQFIHFLSEQGEIFHLGNGYYTLPPVRSIQLPNGQSVVVSSLEDMGNDKWLGIGHQTRQLSYSLMYSEYIYRPQLDEVFNFYKKKLTNNHDIEPNQMLVFSKKGSYKTASIRNMREDDFYILFYDRIIGGKIKPEKYLAQWKNGEWYLTQIPNNMYLRLRQALRSRRNIHSSFRICERENGYIEIKLNSSLPREENILMRLFSMPNEYKWAKKYITTYDQKENVRSILKYYKLREEGE
ncbi:hypothetical protein ACQKFO_19105 [Rossellomorea sp. NPDC071047]|uniref:hypothetical protein n=1 Tax=Rossellomorea sp. NPDC071047 TaxID=3390675 RepID=UPI003CFC7E4A